MSRYAQYIVSIMSLDSDTLREALRTLGAILEDRGVSYEVVVIGGGALLLVGLIERATKDIDVVALAVGDQWVSATPEHQLAPVLALFGPGEPRG
jgi:hypothetical protein